MRQVHVETVCWPDTFLEHRDASVQLPAAARGDTFGFHEPYLRRITEACLQHDPLFEQRTPRAPLNASILCGAFNL